MSIANGFRGFWAKATTPIKVAVVVVAIVLTVNILGVFTSEKSVPTTATETPFEQCTKRGVAYFESLGSGWRLSDGRLALDVAKERCRKTLSAF